MGPDTLLGSSNSNSIFESRGGSPQRSDHRSALGNVFIDNIEFTPEIADGQFEFELDFRVAKGIYLGAKPDAGGER